MPDNPLSCVLLADRNHGLTEGVRGLLETAFGTVVMVADDASLLEAADRLRPNLAIVDLSLARDSGLGWLWALRQRCPDLRVIALSVHDEKSVHEAAMTAGADAVVLKREIATDLLAAVDAVQRGGSVEASIGEGRPAQPAGRQGRPAGRDNKPRKAGGKVDSTDDGKPTCCGPGDLSACAIETAKKPKKARSEADLQAENRGTDEMNKSEKAQPEAARENTSQERK